MRLVIFGATGGTGRRVLERAIAEGHEVTAFVRDPSRLSARHKRLRVVVGDAIEAEPVREAVAGNEAVISVLGARQLSNPLRPGSPGDPKGPAWVGSGNIVAAMKEHGLERFVCQTAWGGESKEGAGLAGSFFMKLLVPSLLRDEYAHKEAQEWIVRRSELEWIIVRPMLLTNGPWTDAYRARADLKPGRRPYVPRADVADSLMRQLSNDILFARHRPSATDFTQCYRSNAARECKRGVCRRCRSCM